MKTKARQIAEDMEADRMAPGSSGLRKLKEAKVSDDATMAKEIIRGLVGGVGGALSGGAGALKRAMGTTPRTEEEMSELTREVGRGMKKGGKVKKYASGGYVRSADGCAQRGKTKGRIV